MKVAKPLEYQIKECLKRISEDDLKFIGSRLSQRFGGDLGEALEFIYANYPEINKILCTALTSEDVYDLVDLIDESIEERLGNPTS